MSELEKENKALKKDYEETEALLDKQIESTLKLYKENEALKKENAELKEVRDNCEQQFQNKVDELGIEVSKNIKAKEIIKYLLNFIHKEGYRSRWDINIKKAEDFIKADK